MTKRQRKTIHQMAAALRECARETRKRAISSGDPSDQLLQTIDGAIDAAEDTFGGEVGRPPRPRPVR